jgi:cytochrome c oxidase assembly factor CtaG
MAATPVHAHNDRALAPHDLPGAWTLDPWVVAPIVLTLFVYLRGVFELWEAAGRGRGLRTWEVGSFLGGVAALILALVSPLHAAGEVLFSAHMVQHEVLMLVAAPLLVLGRPGVAMIWGLPARIRARAAAATRLPEVRGAWRALTAPVVAWMLHAAAIWLWHNPRFFQATLESDAIHALQHVSFLGTAIIFVWTLVHPRVANIGTGGAVVYLFTTAVHTGVLGALLTFAHRPWFDAYIVTTRAWGLSPLEDQQLGGLIMWVPAGAVYLFGALLILARHITEADHPRAVEHTNGASKTKINR